MTRIQVGYRSGDFANVPLHAVGYGTRVDPSNDEYAARRAFSAMRDPRESKDWLVEIDDFDGGAGPSDGGAGTFIDIQAAAQELKARFKLLSLTQDDVDTPTEYGRGYARARLWDAYAEGGRGVCLVFDRAAPTQEFDDFVPPGEIGFHGPVAYRDGQLGSELQFSYTDAVRDGASVAVAIQMTDHRESLFLTKLTDWNTEHEYRFVLETDRAPVDLWVTDSLRAVILGVDTPRIYIPAFRELCERADVELWEMRWVNGGPYLSPVAIYPPGRHF